MHFYHLHLVQAKCKDQVKQEIEQNMEGYENEVYDRFSIRKINLSSESGITHITSKNKNVVWKAVKRKLDIVDNEFESYKISLVKEMKDRNCYDLLNLKRDSINQGMIGYYLRKIGSFISGYFASDTYFYNWVDEGVNITKERFMELVERGDLYAVEINMHY